MQRIKLLLIVAILVAPMTAYADINGDLLKAAEDGDLAQVKELLDKGADIDTRQKGFFIKSLNTPLMLASYNGRKNVAEELLKRGASVNLKNSYDGTALILAAWKGHADIAEMLVKKGADINAQRDNGVTALINAAMHGHPSTARSLIDSGADVNIRKKDGWTALMYAARFGNTIIVKMLLDKDADVMPRSNKGKTALVYAQQKGNREIVRLLQEASPGRDAQATTSVQSARSKSSPSQNARGDVRVKGEKNSCVEAVLKELQANPATRNTPINGEVFVSCENGYVTVQIDCNSWANKEARARLPKKNKRKRRGENFSWGNFLEQTQNPENNIYGQFMIQTRVCENHFRAIAKTAKHASGVKEVNMAQ